MRFTPAAVVLAGVLVLSSSSSIGKKSEKPTGISAAAAPWVESGKAALAADDLETARNAYESALLLSPGDATIYFALGKIARAQKMPGRAIKYFDDSLRLDPDNQRALQEEGLAMMEKGAIESARQTLAQLKTLCKSECAIATPLEAAIAAGPPKIQTAEAGAPGKANPLDK